MLNITIDIKTIHPVAKSILFFYISIYAMSGMTALYEIFQYAFYKWEYGGFISVLITIISAVILMFIGHISMIILYIISGLLFPKQNFGRLEYFIRSLINPVLIIAIEPMGYVIDLVPPDKNMSWLLVFICLFGVLIMIVSAYIVNHTHRLRQLNLSPYLVFILLLPNLYFVIMETYETYFYIDIMEVLQWVTLIIFSTIATMFWLYLCITPSKNNAVDESEIT